MAGHRVYMALPGIISPDATRLKRGEDSVEIRTATAAVQKLSLAPNRACYVKGARAASTWVDLIGDEPPQVRSAQVECDRLLGPSYFTHEEPFLVPERAVSIEAERLVLQVMTGIRTPWERTRVTIETGEAPANQATDGSAPTARKRSERSDPDAEEPEKANQPKRIGVAPRDLETVARPVPVPAPGRAPEEIEKARRRLKLDKQIDALETKRARVIRTMNKSVQKRMVPGIDRQIAEHAAERERLM